MIFTEIIPDCGNDGPEKSLEEPVDKLTKKGDKNCITDLQNEYIRSNLRPVVCLLHRAN